MRQVLRVARASRRLSLYLLIPGLGALSSLIAVPAITAHFGAAGWAVVAVGISVGATAAAICDLGWGIVGPQRIARDPEAAGETYRASLNSKFLALCVLLPVTIGFSVALSDSDKITSALIAGATLLTVMTPNWFFIGRGQPGLIMWTDTLPRLVLSFGSAFAVALGAPLIVYGLGSLAGTVVAVVLGSAIARLPILPARAQLKTAPRVIRDQFPLIAGNVVSTLFTSAPVSILAYSSGPVLIATYSAVDRPMRMGLNVLSGVPARLQSWVGTPDPGEARRRSRVSIGINLGLGVAAMIAFILLAPSVTAVLFSGSVTVTTTYALLGGVLAAQICFSRGLGLALVAAERANSISTAVYAGAAVGITALLVLPPLLGVAGALLAIIAAEAAMIVVQIVQLNGAWKKPLVASPAESVTDPSRSDDAVL